MPTVARFGSLRVVVYPNDHRPPHAHILGREHEAIFFLNCPGGPPELRANYGFSLRELRDMLDQLQRIIERTCAVWGQIHGFD
jgi:hypothetical protein